MDFAEFVAPLSVDTFIAQHWGKAPAHLPAAGRRLDFGWDGLNALFGIRAFWTEAATRLVLNSAPVASDFYFDDVRTLDGVQRLADPAKLDHFMGIGATLVANGAETASPAIRTVAEMLSRRFTAQVGANIYCSFQGVRAFNTHHDDHEVFAVQCEGEKLWRIYANRAERPWEPMPDQATVDAARGPVALEVTTRPGDLLYIPRGQYHDAIAVDSASLHVTFSVSPMSGFLLGRVIEDAIRRDPAFGAYLPGPDEAGGQALLDRLAELAERIALHARSPAVALGVADAQRRLAVPRHAVALPAREIGEHYARTERPCALHDGPNGTVLVVGGRELPLGPAYEAGRWALGRRGFSSVELAANFPHVPAPLREQLLGLLEQAGLIVRYDATL